MGKHKADCTPEEWRAYLDKRKAKRKWKLKADYTPEEWEEHLEKQRVWRENMSEETKQKYKQKQKDIHKQYYEKNKAKIKEKSKQHYEENKQKHLAMNKIRYKRNKDHILAKCKEYREKHKEDYKMQHKKYYNTHKNKMKSYREKNREHRKYIYKQWMNSNKIPYEQYKDRLTIDEDPIQDKDGFLMVRDFHTKEYFYPKRWQIRNRVCALNGNGSGECHLYASEQSKQACPIYHAMPNRNTNKRTVIQIDPIWRKTVIERANGHCERCGKVSDVLHAHHIIPKGVCGMLEEDFDNGMALCPECHREVHSTDGCRLHELAAEKRKAS